MDATKARKISIYVLQINIFLRMMSNQLCRCVSNRKMLRLRSPFIAHSIRKVHSIFDPNAIAVRGNGNEVSGLASSGRAMSDRECIHFAERIEELRDWARFILAADHFKPQPRPRQSASQAWASMFSRHPSERATLFVFATLRCADDGSDAPTDAHSHREPAATVCWTWNVKHTYFLTLFCICKSRGPMLSAARSTLVCCPCRHFSMNQTHVSPPT